MNHAAVLALVVYN